MEWHQWIHDLLLSDDHDIKSIDVSFLDDGKYEAQFNVRWRGDFKDGSFTDLNIEQRWIMYESIEFDHPVIEQYVAEVIEHKAGK
ncbi:hypothetical protein F0237_03355 [Vibrio tubiashii]|uniref:Uncharacterized protein n=2 Tax=Vibrio tubiashii TaxID=29498 RepID=A0AAE5GMS9_9VIBR|nr:hypothetical protein [Vibrio tubiashii]